MLPSGEKEREGSTLSLRNVSRLDSGVYICSAANGVDRAVTARIQLKVICEFRSFVLLFAFPAISKGLVITVVIFAEMTACRRYTIFMYS